MADNTTLNTGTGGDVIASDDITGVKYQRVKLVLGADGVNNGDVATGNPLPINVGTVGTTSVNAFPAGFIRVTDEPKQIFYDPFDAALDTTNLWTTPTVAAPGVIAAVSAGVMTMGAGATASGWSKLTSQSTFKLSVPAWLGYSFAIAIPDLAAINANTTRFWGAGSIPATPTVGVPITDGVGFELSSGKMYAVVYAGGTRTQIQDMSAATGNATAPTDTAYHRYIVIVRTDKTYWYVDGLGSTNLAATSNFQSPQVQTLGQSFVAVGSATNAAAANIQCAGSAVWDTGKNATQIADGAFPWRKQTVKAASTAAAATDLPAVVALHPTSPLPAGTSVIGALSANQSVNVAQIAGTAPTTVGKLDVKGADGDVFVRQATGTNLHTVIDSGTVTTVSTVSAARVVGNAGAIFDAATAAAVPANALYTGARAATANPTNATGGNMVGHMADKAGRLVVTHGHVRELIGIQTQSVASVSETTIITAGGAGVFNDLSQLIITTAGAAAQTITIKDATAGTTRMVFNYPNAALAPGAPLIVNFNPPVPQATANANWTTTNSVATATNITCVFAKNL